MQLYLPLMEKHSLLVGISTLLETRKEERAKIVAKIIQDVKNTIHNGHNQRDLFSEQIGLIEGNYVTLIESVLVKYRLVFQPTDQEYHVIAKEIGIPPSVVISYIHYCDFFARTTDVVGRVRNTLTAWVRQSILLGKDKDLTFNQAFKETFCEGKMPDTEAYLTFKDFFKTNQIHYNQLILLIPYLSYRELGILPDGKIRKSIKT